MFFIYFSLAFCSPPAPTLASSVHSLGVVVCHSMPRIGLICEPSAITLETKAKKASVGLGEFLGVVYWFWRNHLPSVIVGLWQIRAVNTGFPTKPAQVLLVPEVTHQTPQPPYLSAHWLLPRAPSSQPLFSLQQLLGFKKPEEKRPVNIQRQWVDILHQAAAWGITSVGLMSRLALLCPQEIIISLDRPPYRLCCIVEMHCIVEEAA